MDNEIKFLPYIKLNSRDADIEKAIEDLEDDLARSREYGSKKEEGIPTNLTGMYFYVPGQSYYILSGDGTCGKYATTIISIFIDKNGTHIVHKPYKVSSNSNIYSDRLPFASPSSGRQRFSL